MEMPAVRESRHLHGYSSPEADTPVAHDDSSGHGRFDRWQVPPALGAIASAAALAGACGILAGAIARYLTLHGPSGPYPHSWSYTGNGALVVLAYCPLILMASWTVLAVWERGYRRYIAVVTGLAVLLTGLLAGVVNEVGVVGQLPNVETTLPIFSSLINSAVAVVALTVALGLAARFAEVSPRRAILALILMLVTVIVALGLALTGRWFWLSFAQSLLAPLTILLPLLAARPQTGQSHLASSRVVTVAGSVLVPLALVGGFVLEASTTG